MASGRLPAVRAPATVVGGEHAAPARRCRRRPDRPRRARRRARSSGDGAAAVPTRPAARPARRCGWRRRWSPTPGAAQRGGGQRGHRPGADDERPHVRRGRRRRRRRRSSADGDQRLPGPVDAGLGVGALADPQRLLEQRRSARGRPCRAPGRRGARRGPGRGSGSRRRPSSRGRQATENRCCDGAVLVVDVEVRRELVDGHAGVLGEQRGDARRRRRGTGRRRRRPRCGCRSTSTVASATCSLATSVVQQLGTPSASSATPLEQRDRGGPVGDADDEDAHADVHRRALDGGERAAVRPAALRCSWKARICSSMDEVDLAHVDAVGHGQHGRREVEDAGDPGRDQPVADVLGGAGRGGDHADRDAVLARRSRSRSSMWRIVEPGDLLADAARVGVEQRRRPGSRGRRSRRSWPARGRGCRSDDDDGPVLGQAELAGDLVDEVVDVVADAAGAVGAEVGQVLAELGGVDAGGGGELLAGDTWRRRASRQRGQRAQVDRQPGDGRLGMPRSAAVARSGPGNARSHDPPGVVAGGLGRRSHLRSL